MWFMATCIIMNFPVPAQWTSWTSWSSCSLTCGPGANRRRSRAFIPGRYGGKTQPDESVEETQNCLKFDEHPNPCPVPASYGQWGTWSGCSATCNLEDRPEIRHSESRRRSCTEATLSNIGRVNVKITKCRSLTYRKESRRCDLPNCPGNIDN